MGISASTILSFMPLTVINASYFLDMLCCAATKHLFIVKQCQ